MSLTRRALTAAIHPPTLQKRFQWRSTEQSTRFVQENREMVADAKLGLLLGQVVTLGNDRYTVVGLTRGAVDARLRRQTETLRKTPRTAEAYTLAARTLAALPERRKALIFVSSLAVRSITGTAKPARFSSIVSSVVVSSLADRDG